MIFLDLYLIISKCMFHSKTKRQTDKTQRSSLTLRRIQCYVYIYKTDLYTLNLPKNIKEKFWVTKKFLPVKRVPDQL